MIFSVSNDGFEWSLNFGSDPVTLNVKDHVHEKTVDSQEIPSAAWSLLLSQRRDILNDNPARVPVTCNQKATMEMRDKVLSSVGAQDMDTSKYQVADLNYFDFYWKIGQLDTDAVFMPGIDTPLHQQRLTTQRWEVR